MGVWLDRPFLIIVMIKAKKYKVTTEPTTEPVTLTEAKIHLRVTQTNEDSLITSLIQVARQWCEAYEGRKYITQTLTVKYDNLDGVMVLPFGPAQSITSLKYIDESEAEQTVSSDDYSLDTYGDPPSLYADYGVSFPVPLAVRNSAEIIYVAGYGAASAVPERVKCAIKLVLSHLFEHREHLSEIKLEKMAFDAMDLLHNRAFYE